MGIWEDAYSRLKQGAIVPEDQPQLQMKQDSFDTLNQLSKSGDSDSLEKKYCQPGKTQPVNKRDQEWATQSPAQFKTVKSRFVPRIQTEKLSSLYPAILSKMHQSLSETWANIMLETKQTIETLLVCGSSRKEGNTFVSFHLAMFLSKEYDMKVLYVDTNLHHKAISQIQNRPGVYSFVSEQNDLASLLVKSEYPGLYLLPSGSGTGVESIGRNMLSLEHIEAIIQFCRNNFDITIIDGQPLVSSPVMIEFARVVDMTLLVCRYGVTRYEVSQLAVERLQKYGVSSIGVILNDRQFPVPQKIYKILG